VAHRVTPRAQNCRRCEYRDTGRAHWSNSEALQKEFRLFSAYPIDPAKPREGFGKNTLWIITEADAARPRFFCRASIDNFPAARRPSGAGFSFLPA
jgi:hypothetical protein